MIGELLLFVYLINQRFPHRFHHITHNINVTVVVFFIKDGHGILQLLIQLIELIGGMIGRNLKLSDR